MSSSKYLTISVDDGHPTDFRSAELLSRFDLKATFYIPKSNPEREVIGENQVRELSGLFEVGAHTISHTSLNVMDDKTALREIADGKQWLEDVTGKPVPAFCYPQGKFNSRTPGLIKEAGFKGARTCMFNRTDFPSNPFLWGLSTHAYSHSIRIQLQHALIERNVRGAVNFLRINKCAQNWTQHFTNTLNYVETNGGIAHLYFHSWEIDQNNHWRHLEDLLRIVSKRKDFVRLTNGELFNLWWN